MNEPFTSKNKEKLNEVFYSFISRKNSETSVDSDFSEEEQEEMKQGAVEVRRVEEHAETSTSRDSSDSDVLGNGILHKKTKVEGAGTMENIGNGVPFIREGSDNGDVPNDSKQEGSVGGTEPTNATRKRKAALAEETMADGSEVNSSAISPACPADDQRMATALHSRGSATSQHATQEEENGELKWEEMKEHMRATFCGKKTCAGSSQALRSLLASNYIGLDFEKVDEYMQNEVNSITSISKHAMLINIAQTLSRSISVTAVGFGAHLLQRKMLVRSCSLNTSNILERHVGVLIVTLYVLDAIAFDDNMTHPVLEELMVHFVPLRMLLRVTNYLSITENSEWGGEQLHVATFRFALLLNIGRSRCTTTVYEGSSALEFDIEGAEVCALILENQLNVCSASGISKDNSKGAMNITTMGKGTTIMSAFTSFAEAHHYYYTYPIETNLPTTSNLRFIQTLSETRRNGEGDLLFKTLASMVGRYVTSDRYCDARSVLHEIHAVIAQPCQHGALKTTTFAKVAKAMEK